MECVIENQGVKKWALPSLAKRERAGPSTRKALWFGLSLFLFLLAPSARAQVQNMTPTGTYPIGPTDVDPSAKINYNWIGGSTIAFVASTAPVNYILQVSNDPNFGAANIAINMTIPAVISSTMIATVDGYYISTFTLTNQTTYYWRVYAQDGSNQTSSWSTYTFVTDWTAPSATNYESIGAGGSPVLYNQFNALAAGVTAQITVQDTGAGLAVSNNALNFSGNGTADQYPTSGYGVTYSTDAGQNWIGYSTTTSSYDQLLNTHVLAVFNGYLFAGGDYNGGKLAYTADGTNWLVQSPVGGGLGSIFCSTVFNGNFYVGGGGIAWSPDGLSWNSSSINVLSGSIGSLAVFNGRIYATDLHNVYTSADGQSWTYIQELSGYSATLPLTAFNGKLYAVDYGGNVYSTSDGIHWSPGQSVGIYSSLAVFNGKLYGADNGNIYSTSNGISWTAQTVGTAISPFGVLNGNLYAGDTSTGFVYWTSDGTHWVGSSVAASVGLLAAFNGQLYAADADTIYQITPLSATLGGSNGTTAAETLAYSNLQLAPSTSTANCDGTFPCTATNQIIFSAMGMAGNAVRAGPYSILVDTEVGVAVSTPSYPANNSYVNVQPNFDWIGPSTGVASALQAPAYFNLEVSSNDPNFAPANLVINISTPVIVYSTNVPTADGAYISPYTLASGVTYYYRINIKDNLGGTSPWSQTFSFITDFPPPTSPASSFESLNSQSLPTPEGTFNDLALGVTAQITVQDAVSGLAVSTNALNFAGDGHDDPQTTSGYGVMYSTNAGQTWIDDYAAANIPVASNPGALAVFNGSLYLAAGGDVYSSADGVVWSGGTPLSGSGTIYAFSVFNGKLYAGTNSGNVYSYNGSGVWSGAIPVSVNHIFSMAVFNGKLYAGDYLGSIQASADGVNWSAAGTASQSVYSMVAFNGQVYAGSLSSDFYSSPDGIRWSAGTNIVEPFVVFNGELYGGDYSSGDVYSSPDGVNWNNRAHLGAAVNAMAVFNGKIYAQSGGYLYSSPDGSHWNIVTGSLGSMAGFNGNLYATNSSGVTRITPVSATLSGSNGTTAAQTLSATNLNLVQSTNSATCGGVSPCGATDQVIFTAADMAGNIKESGPYAILVDTTVATAISTPSYPVGGQYVGLNPNFNWAGPSTSTVLGLSQPASFILEVSNNDPFFGTSVINITKPIIVNSTNVSTADGAYISTYTLLNATTYYWRVRTLDGFGGLGPWSQVTSFVTDFTPPSTSAFASLNKSGGLVPESQVTVLISGVTAQLTLQDLESGLAVSTSALSFSGDGHDDPFAASGYGVIYSTDAGQTWIDSSTHSVVSSIISGPATPASAIAVYNGNIYAALHSALQSSPDGINWSAVSDASGTPTALAVFNGNFFIGDPGGRIFSNPNLSAPVFSAASSIESLSAFDERIYAGDLNGHVYASSDGIHWGLVFSDTQTTPSVQALMGFNGQIYAGDASGNIYQSGNGTAWTDVFKGNNISALSVFNNKIYAADSNNGKIYVSSDGVHWNIAFTGPSGAYSMTLFEGKLYAGYLASAYETPDGIHWAKAVFDGAMGNVDSLSGFNQVLYLGDSNGVLWQSSSVFASLNGLNGTTSSEILSAYGLNLAASTDTYICDNSNPCGATNQIMFTGSNMAGDDISAGPFAIIVDTHSTDVLVSTTNIAPSQMPQNTAQGFTRLVMNALAGTADWNGLVIQRLGSSVDSDISNVAIYRDSLNNGVFVATADAQISNPAVFSNGVASVTLVSPEGIGISTQSYFIALQAAPAATDGDVVISEVLSSASFSFSNGYQMSAAQSIYPFASSPSTIVDGPNNLYITPYNTAPADLAPGTTQVPLLSLKNYTNTGTSTYSKIVFHLLGTAASSDISSISVYRDVNNTGVFAPNDTLLTSGADGFSGGVSTVDFTASAASDTINMTPVYLFVVINLSPSAPLGDTFGVAISTPSDVYIDPLDTTIFTSTPVASSLVTVEYVNTLNVQGVSQIPPSLLQGQEYTVLKASFTVSTGKTAFNGLDITRLGLSHDSDVSSVKVWADPNPPEAFNPAIFQLLGSGIFNSGTTQISFSTQTLNAGTTYVYYVTYDISPTAIQGDTLGGRITSNLDVTDTNPGTTIIGNFSIDSSTSPIVPTSAGLFVSAQNVAPSNLLQGATNQQMLNLTMDTTQYAVALTALTFNSLGSASSTDISRVEIYQDVAGNGILNTSSDPLLAAVSYPFISGTGIIPFSSPGITISTTPIRLLVAVDVSTGANYINNDFGIGISTSSNISINSPNFVVPSTQTFPADSSIIPITKAPDVMSVYPTSLMDPSGVVQGQNAPAAELFLQTQHSSVTWTTISIQRSGTLPDSGVDSVNIYYDADQNGVFDSSDVLVGSAPFVSAQASISFSSAQLVNPQGSNYFITVQIDPNATPGDTIGISLSGASNFTVAPPDSVSGSSLPFNSALAPVLNIKTPTQPIVTFPNGDFSSSFDSIGFIWYSTVAVGSISSAAYAVGTTPGGTDIAPYTSIPFAASSFTATNLLLSNGATYYVSVEATSSFGFTSPAGISPGFLVDLITPGSPTNLAANVGVSSIYLTWDPGTAGPSGLAGYLLEYSDVEHPTWYNAKTGAVTALTAGPHGTLSANFIASAPFLFNNPPQGTLLFRVSSVNGAGVQSSPSNTIRVLYGTQSTAGISNVSSYPNPFNSNSGVATIVYTLDAPGSVSIQIYSVFGNLVKNLSYSGGGSGGQTGVNTVTWDGTDAGGRKVSKGIYIAILKANGATVQYKIGVNH